LDKYPNNELYVYNRWGDLVYEADPYHNDWNGAASVRATGSGVLPSGTYYYILKLGDGIVSRGFFYFSSN